MPHAALAPLDVSIPPVRTRVPQGLDGTNWAAIAPCFDELRSRPIATRADIEQWLIDRSELEAACSQSRANLYIAMTANTDDREINAAYTAYLENVAPRLEEAVFELDRRFVSLVPGIGLSDDRYRVLIRNKRAAVELFRPENIPIQTELGKLGQDYSKIAGAQSVIFEGQERTLAQMAVYQQSTDRAVREDAWRAVAERRLADRDALDDIFDKMIERRDTLAFNAGCRVSGPKGPLRVGPFVEFAFKEKHRFDYTPADCRSFWAAVEKHVVPMMRRLDERRRRSLGLASLRPWDMAVDLKGRTGLRPFEGGRELFDKSVNVMEALDPRLGGLLRRLGLGAPATPDPARGFVSECLDLDSRKGKRPGGYMYVRDRSRTPFIFMNSAGLHRDVMTMVHEAGHAFHSMLAGPEWLLDYRDSPTEFAEVASMSMEHLTMPHWATNGRAGATRFYAQKQDADRARREHLEDSIMILAWIATIDSFQHWIYADPKHTRTQRDDYWLELDQRFGHALDWGGLDDHHRCVWQRQGHLFSHPMYYIEYGIAQLGAFQLWLKSVREGETAAVDAYIRALRLGGSRPLPELFAAAGIRFDFGEPTVASIVEAVERQLETLDR